MKSQTTDILIEGLDVQCHIGVPPEERMVLQAIILDVVCELGEHTVQKDMMEESLSYVWVVEEIRSLAQRKEFVLLETFTQEIAELVLQDLRVQVVHVTARKMHKLPDCAAVGVRRSFVRSFVRK